jgi:HEPN domain-containing protein
MKTATEWQGLFAVAEADRQAMELLLNSDIPLAIACFHGQQAVEKYMKAVLRCHAVIYPFTHDLEELRGIFEDQKITLPLTELQAVTLNPFAVSQRYDLPPEYGLTRQELKEIVDLIAKWCEKSLWPK